MSFSFPPSWELSRALGSEQEGPSSPRGCVEGEPGFGTSPPGPVDPGHGHILQDENEEEGQRGPVVIQQVHVVAARGLHEEAAAQEHGQADTHWREKKKKQTGIKVRIQAGLEESWWG